MPIHSIPGFEEPFSSFSHLFAAPVFLVWGILLIRQHGKGALRCTGLILLLLATVFLLSMSGVYHLLGDGIARDVLRHLDIAGVFALIAATATPIHVAAFRGWLRWMPLGIWWSVAASGITLRTIFSDSLPFVVGTMIFLAMGWGGVFTCGILWRRYGFYFVELLLYGGIAYSIGAVAMSLHYPTLIPGVIGPHEFWHVAVLVGLFFHWLFIAKCMRAFEEDGEFKSKSKKADETEEQ
ncbi:MAG: hemolysin III family protein [Planctomycetota bacterium]